MSGLKVMLFGSLRVSHQTGGEEPRLPHSVQALLAYLLLQRQRTHPRELLAGLFWGDYSQERARNCLNTALWRLRKTLEPEDVPCGTYLVRTGREEVGFNGQADYWLDVEAFEQAARLLRLPPERLTADDVAQLEAAARLYRGDLLEGFYEDWALEARERLRSTYLDYLAHLLRAAMAGRRHEAALAYAHKLLAADPLREDIHREAMRLHLALGNRAAAARQYAACCEKLRQAFDIAPMEETRRLFEQIDAAPPPAAPPPAAPPHDLESALLALQRSVAGLEMAQADLRQAMGVVQAYLRPQPTAGAPLESKSDNAGDNTVIMR